LNSASKTDPRRAPHAGEPSSLCISLLRGQVRLTWGAPLMDLCAGNGKRDRDGMRSAKTNPSHGIEQSETTQIEHFLAIDLHPNPTSSRPSS